MRVLVVEDTRDLADALVRYLRAEGHAVDHVSTAAEADSALRVSDYGAIILDLGLPDGSGLDLLRAERARGNRAPVLIATARDGIADRIAGLDAGADDYVLKPFDLGEVAARLRAHARRATSDGATDVTVGPYRVDLVAGRVFGPAGEVRLTSREWSVLAVLVSARGRVRSRAALEEALYSFDDEIAGNAVEVYVSRLRAKLGPGIIETRRGLGYLVP
ncbi:response regulator [Amaricoccus solimangrovi]|uniref:Response regulator transcription factor n=1 Tax=Amaricoccus solimangrovi TaxID=2589815 RepID=A0A501WP91_9RHOB|nr:response regulator transcription factor [Amaricoccus solimangrovi]TPE50145.1 response regulator transcription factor [Amaricoccus solimangrovi]